MIPYSFETKIKARFSFIAISIIWGSTWSISKLGIDQMPPVNLACMRNFMAGIIMLTFFLVNGMALPTLKQIKKYILLSFLLFTANILLSLYSLAYIPTHIAAIIGCTSPFFIYVIAQIKKRDNANYPFLIGCTLSLLGVVTLVSNQFYNEEPHHYFLGILLSILAVLVWSIGYHIMEINKETENLNYSFAWQLMISGITLFTFSLFSNTPLDILHLTFTNWLIVSYLAIFGSVIAFICLACSIKYLPSNINSLYVFLNPLVAFLINFFFFDYSINAFIIIGFILIISGLWISSNIKSICFNRI